MEKENKNQKQKRKSVLRVTSRPEWRISKIFRAACAADGMSGHVIYVKNGDSVEISTHSGISLTQANKVKSFLRTYEKTHENKCKVFIFEMNDFTKDIMQHRAMQSKTVAEMLQTTDQSIRTTISQYLSGKTKESELLYRICELEMEFVLNDYKFD